MAISVNKVTEVYIHIIWLKKKINKNRAHFTVRLEVFDYLTMKKEQRSCSLSL